MKKSESRTKLIMALTLTIALVFSMSASVFAASSDEIAPYQTFSVTTGFDRTGNTSASGEITANTYSIATYIKATVTLQERVSSGVFRDVTNISPATQSKKVTNTSGIYFWTNWNLKSNTSYRLKVVIEDKTGDVIYRDTSYSNIA